MCRIFHACHQPSQVSFLSYNGQQGCGQLGEGELGSWTFDDTGRGEGEEERERREGGREGGRMALVVSMHLFQTSIYVGILYTSLDRNE